MTEDLEDQDSTAAALNAAAAWLGWLGAEHGSVAVVQFLPDIRVGVHAPGRDAVGMLQTLDAAASAVVLACMPWGLEARDRLDDATADAVARALEQGARLRVLVAPATQSVVLVAEAGGQRAVLCGSRAELRPESLQ